MTSVYSGIARVMADAISRLQRLKSLLRTVRNNFGLFGDCSGYG
ncbi:MAG: hypothetical protein ACRC8Y_15840 [Chroococcales cyanobacterium]